MLFNMFFTLIIILLKMNALEMFERLFLCFGMFRNEKMKHFSFVFGKLLLLL